MKKDDSLVELGQCKKPHGIKGGFCFYLENLDESILKKGQNIVLYPLDKSSDISVKGETYKVKSIQFGNKVIAYLSDIEDRNKVEAMIPFIIKIAREDFPLIKDDEYYLSDLVGCKVFNNQTNEEIGIVENFYENSAQTVVVINKNEGGVIELPLVEHFVPVIDISNKIVKINPPEIIE